MYFPGKIGHFLENGGIWKNEIIWVKKKPVIITNSINKTVLLPLCDNKSD
jgi:hypothetical protein